MFVPDPASINSYSYMTIRWLQDRFDPATRARAAGTRRLLFLDGPDIRTSVEFLEACWERWIVCHSPCKSKRNLSAS